MPEGLRDRFDRDGYVVLDGELDNHAELKAMLVDLLEVGEAARPRSKLCNKTAATCCAWLS